MSIAVVFAVFILFMGISLVLNISMIIPLGAGFVLFAALACRRGFALKKVMSFAVSSQVGGQAVLGRQL